MPIVSPNRNTLSTLSTPTTGRTRSELWLILIAFAITYFVWGSTYLANWWAVHSIPPFLLAGARFTFAGLLMYVIGRMAGQAKVTALHWRNALFAGILLFVIGNGALVWALQYIDSGIVALMVAFEPLMVVGFQWKMRGRKPGWDTLFGIMLGIIGMLLLVGQPEFVADPHWMTALIAIFIGMIGWAYVSVWLTEAEMPNSVFQTAALQMLTGGAVLLLIALLHGDIQAFHLAEVTNKAWWSLGYLIIGGSILAFTAFNFLLKKVATEKVVTNTYVNPVVALFLGWWLNKEHISNQSLLASILLLGGVILINSRLIRRKKK
ncbi:MAG: EamA family transporter [Saprospirales bacterium]|nr:EamA family transporter [Saprospirales bacterium]